MLKVRGLTKSFGASKQRLLFGNLELDVGSGEFIAIMGESGNGKSTLLNLIAGLDTPDHGSIEIDAISITDLGADQRARFRRDNIGFVFQAFHLLPYLSVEDNVALPLILQGITTHERKKRVIEILATVGLADRASAWPRELSGGEAQRVALARALVHGPKLILADEPTGNLDQAHARQALELLRASADAHRVTCVLVTHSVSAARIADRVYMLADGSLRQHDLL